MKFFLTVLIMGLLTFQPVLRAEEKVSADATAAAGKALDAVSLSEESEEELQLEDLGIADEIGLEEDLEEDEFDGDDNTGTVDLTDKR